jgi:hypothetical protein
VNCFAAAIAFGGLPKQKCMLSKGIASHAQLGYVPSKERMPGILVILTSFPEARFRIANGMVRRLFPAGNWGIRGERRRHPMELHTIGIDLGKTVFHLVGLNLRGEVVVHKKFSRKQLLHFTANLKVELIGMEACVT